MEYERTPDRTIEVGLSARDKCEVRIPEVATVVLDADETYALVRALVETRALMEPPVSDEPPTSMELYPLGEMVDRHLVVALPTGAVALSMRFKGIGWVIAAFPREVAAALADEIAQAAGQSLE